MKESEEGVDVTVLAERRAKLAKLRGEHFVHDRDITSAPSVTVVDEFENNFAAATFKNKLDKSLDISKNETEQKIFFAEKNKIGNERKRKTSDLEFNNLVNEANRRGGRQNSTVRDDFSFADEETDEYSIASSMSGVGGMEKFEDTNEMAKNTDMGFDHQGDKSQQRKLSRALTFAGQDYTSDHQPRDKKNPIENEKSTRMYQDGQYVYSSEDLGYQSSTSSPNESKRKAESFKMRGETGMEMKKSGQMLKVEKAMDPLSMSLPETFLKTVKNDLSESIKSTTSTCSKVVYDPRMFNGQSKVAPNNSLDPEKEYFEKMHNFHGNNKQQRNDLSADQTRELRPKDAGIAGDEPSALECIDLNDPVHDATKDNRRHTREIPDSPAMSDRTEFDDPDIHGKSRKKKNIGNKTLGGVLLSISSIGLKFGKDNGDGLNQRKRNQKDSLTMNSSLGNSYSSWSGRSPHPGHGEEEECNKHKCFIAEECKICMHRKRTSCWTVMALLALDIFTIGLIIIMFNQMHSQPKGIGGHLAQTGGVPDHHHDQGDPHQEPQVSKQGRRLDLPIFNETDNSYLESPRIIRKDDRWIPPNDVIVYNSIIVNEDTEDEDTTREGRKSEFTTPQYSSKITTLQNLVARMRITTLSTSRASSTSQTKSTRFVTTSIDSSIAGSINSTSTVSESTTYQNNSSTSTISTRNTTVPSSQSTSSLYVKTSTTEPSSNISASSSLQPVDSTLVPSSSSTEYLSPTTTSLPSYHVSLSAEVETLQHDLQSVEATLADLKSKFEEEMQDLKEQIQKMRSPPAFSCHKTDSHTSETKVFYSDCSISTPGMDSNTGIFLVKEAGVYQITFTGFFVSLRGHMVSADIYLRTGDKDEIIGRSSAKTDEDGVFGRDDDLHATTSIIVMENLKKGDKVFVSMVISGPHGDSKMESDFSRKIHFTGLKISDGEQ